MRSKQWIGVCVVSALSCQVALADFSYKGNLSLQAQIFTSDPLHTANQSSNLSLSGETELYKAFGDGDSSVLFTPFVRLDENDEQRTHVDVRELKFVRAADTWEFSAGIAQVFWGVAESRNVVDIINQEDQLESFASDAKLGQPMINLTLVRDWGDLAFYVLPGFREKDFPGVDGRPRLPLLIDADASQYESSDEEQHIDYAIRYSHYIDEWDIGLSYFKGTAREPLLIPVQSASNGQLSLQPFYYQLDQAGIDVQATLESWLLKSELVHRSGNAIEDHLEFVGGIEYSFYGILDSDADLGVVAEYLWDERDRAPQLFQNDFLLGLRLALNDEQSTEALLGLITDLDDSGVAISLEASRRIGNSFKFSANALFWENTDNDSDLAALRKEDFLEFELGYFF